MERNAKVIDVKKMFASKDLSEDPVLQPGDMIVVPQNRFSKVARFLPPGCIGIYESNAVQRLTDSLVRFQHRLTTGCGQAAISLTEKTHGRRSACPCT